MQVNEDRAVTEMRNVCLHRSSCQSFSLRVPFVGKLLPFCKSWHFVCNGTCDLNDFICGKCGHMQYFAAYGQRIALEEAGLNWLDPLKARTSAEPWEG